MKILLGFTGGVDSTYLLYKLLTETTDEITALYVDFTDTDIDYVIRKQHLAEMMASNIVIDWLKDNTRNFEYRILKQNDKYSGYWVSPILMKIASSIMSEGFDVFYTARTIESSRQSKGADTIGWFKEMFAEGGVGEWRCPLMEWNKSRPHAYAELPPALMSIVTSCLDLEYIDQKVVQCGKCWKCLASIKITNELAEGRDVEKIVEDVNRHRMVGEGFSTRRRPDSYGGSLAVKRALIPDKWKFN